MKTIKIKYITAVILICKSLVTGQAQESFSNEPYPVYKSGEKTVIAGSVSTHSYENYTGSNVKSEKYADAHSKPEYLVYELFRKMKESNIAGIGELYDTSFSSQKTDGDFSMLSAYTDIKFHSKFKTGDYEIVRYDFVSGNDVYPYFAAVKNIEGKYFLTTDINVSSPFNLIGSYSPQNMSDGTIETSDVTGMTGFYFIENESKIFYTAEKPDEDYTGLYLSFNFYDKDDNSEETQFTAKIGNAFQVKDSMKATELILPEQKKMLKDKVVNSYFRSELGKIFKNSSTITPIASLNVNDGIIMFLKADYNKTSKMMFALFLARKNGKLYIKLKNEDDTLNNLFQNGYIKEAVFDYLMKR